nr:ribonuclease H-like domain-containing protein [Tanacetum cinerariifolium]
MTLTFAETHNMVAYLSKSDSSEGFNQIINFLNGSSIKYALTVNPNIYVSCIKQFWTTVTVKQVNDVTRLQALVDKKKVVVTEATVREALRLDDEEGAECLPNEEIFAELARIGYEKPSTKLTFYKAFFLSQWKNVDSPTKFYMYPCFLQLMIDLSTNTTKYTSPALTQKVFANMRRVCKGFSGVETPLFEGMLVEQQVVEEGDVDGNDETVNIGDAAKGDVTAAHGEVLTVDEEPPIPSPTPPTPPPQHLKISLLLPRYNQHHHNHLRRVEHLEFDKVAQALEITKLKKRVKKLERRNMVRVLKLRRLQRVRTSQRVKTFDEIVMDDVSNQGMMIAKMDQDTDVVLEDDKEDDKEVADEAKELIIEVVTAASETITAVSAIITADEAQVPAVTLTTAPVRVTAAPSEAIDHVKRKAKEDPSIKRYQVLKRKPQTDAQARKNMMVYLKNVAGFKMDYFKGMSYDDIRPIFEAKLNSNVAFLLKTKKQIEKDENKALQRLNETPAERAAKRRKLDEEVEVLKRHLQIMPNEDNDVYTEATPLARNVPVVDYQIIEMNNKPYYKIIRADDAHQLYVNDVTRLQAQVDKKKVVVTDDVIRELSVIGATNVSHFEILCRVYGFDPTVGLFCCFSVNSKNKGWMSFSKRLGTDAVCYIKPLDSLKGWNDHFSGSTPLPVLPYFRGILTVNPTKVRVGERERDKGEPKLLETTIGRVVPGGLYYLPILNPNEFDLWKMRIKQYFLMIDYSLWEVILNGDSPAPTRVIKGVVQPVAPTTAENRLARKNELKARGTFLMALPSKHQLKFNIHKDAKTLMDEIVKRFGENKETKKVQKTLLKQQYKNFTGSSSESFDQIHNRLTNEPINAATSVSAVSAKIPFSALPNIDADDLEEMDFKWQMAMLTVRARSPTDTRRNGAAEPQRRNVPIETSTSNALVSQCDGVGSYDWSFQAEEEPTNYALMAYTSSSSSSSDNEPETKFSPTNSPLAPIIKDWVSDSEDDSEATIPQNAPSFVQPNEQVKTPRSSIKPVKTSIPAANHKIAIPKPKSQGNNKNRKECFVCKSLDHLIKDCDFYEKKMAQTPPRNHPKKENHQHYARMTLLNPQRHVVPKAVLTKSMLLSLIAARPVTAVVLKLYVTRPRQAKTVVTKPYSPPRRHIDRSPSPKSSNFPPRVTAAKAPMDKGVIDSGCSRHMTGNMSFLSNFEAIIGGYVTFGENPKGGKIFKKGKIRTGDFDDVYFVKELKFNLFSISQMCDKKNNVLFTDTECLVLSPKFKLPDENQVLLRVPRENNMYNVYLKNTVPSEYLTRLFAKKTLDESNLWNRRLGYINFKTMNNLVRGLPSKVFENDHTCVACKKGKQHRASCKTKPINSVNQPLQRLHMDLFRPTFVKSLNKKCYCLVVTDDYSRTLIEATRTMLADSLLPIPFWVEAVNINTDGDAAFKVKEPEFEGRKPEFEVHVSPSSSAQSKKHDDETKREAKGKRPVESSIGYRNLSVEFKDFFDNSINEVNVVGSLVLAVGQISSNNTNTFSAASPSNAAVNITYSDDEEDVGAEADFTNLETSITVSSIPTTRVHKDHPVTQIIGDLSSATQTRSMTRVAKDQGFEDPDHSNKVYKVVKALYGLHQAPRAWYETLANYLLENGFQREKIGQTSFIKRKKGNILLVQIYVDDIIFGSTNKDLCKAFEKLMKDKFQISSMGELTFFLGLQVKQKKDEIFISQYKYVAEILRKFGLTYRKSTSTPIDTKNPLLKDPNGEDIDVHTYR